MKKIIIISHFAANRKRVASNRINYTFKYIKEFKKILIIPKIYKCEMPANYLDKSFDIIDCCLNIDPDAIRHTIKALLKKIKIFNSRKVEDHCDNILNNKKENVGYNKKDYSFMKSFAKIFEGRLYVNVINFIDIYKFNILFIFIKLLKHARDKEVIIFISGKPFSYLIPCYLYKVIFKNKIVFDLRDDWVVGEFITSSLLSKLESKIKKKLLQNCDTIITVSEPIMTELKKWTDTPIYVITNGFDGEVKQSKGLNFRNSNKINIGYFGNLYYYAGENLMLDCIEESENFDKIQIDFYGTINAQSRFHRSNFVSLLSMVSEEELICKMREYNYLLLLLPYHSYQIGVYSGKIFDYIRSGVPILAVIAEKGNEPAIQLINETKTGIIVDPDDREKLLTVLNNLDNELFVKKYFQPQLSKIEQYSRNKLAEKFMLIFNAVSC